MLNTRIKIIPVERMKNVKTYSSKEIRKILEQDGWMLKRIVGSHHHFKHPVKKGTVAVPLHENT